MDQQTRVAQQMICVQQAVLHNMINSMLIFLKYSGIKGFEILGNTMEEGFKNLESRLSEEEAPKTAPPEPRAASPVESAGTEVPSEVLAFPKRPAPQEATPKAEASPEQEAPHEEKAEDYGPERPRPWIVRGY